MANGNGDSVDFKTGLFGIKLAGPNALVILLFITLLASAGLTFVEHVNRSQEHQQLQCSIRLSIFIYTTPKGTPIDWDRLPVDLYECVPKFLFDRPVAR